MLGLLLRVCIRRIEVLPEHSGGSGPARHLLDVQRDQRGRHRIHLLPRAGDRGQESAQYRATLRQWSERATETSTGVNVILRREGENLTSEI